MSVCRSVYRGEGPSPSSEEDPRPAPSVPEPSPTPDIFKLIHLESLCTLSCITDRIILILSADENNQFFIYIHWVPLKSSVKTSRSLFIKIFDYNVKKFDYNEHLLVTSSFFCIFLRVVSETCCSLLICTVRRNTEEEPDFNLRCHISANSRSGSKCDGSAGRVEWNAKPYW